MVGLSRTLKEIVATFKTSTSEDHFIRTHFYPQPSLVSISLPSHIQNAPSIAAFKNMLNTNTQPSSSPQLFDHGPRNLQILHTRLRTNCSSLAAHLFRKKNINDSPNCISCDEIEDCNHFFFHCDKFSVERAQLINSVSQICSPSLYVFLFGDPSLCVDENCIIFDHVQRFIK